MDSAVSFLAFGLQLSVCTAIACSPPYSDILGVCLNFTTQKTTYCGAQAYCLSVEGELVRGSNYLPLAGKTFPGMPERYWIGLTDLLLERNSSREGWRWTDGAVEPSSSKLVWIGSWEPGNTGGIQDCIFQLHGSGKIADTNCTPSSSWQVVPMCQPKPLSTSAVRMRHFEAVSIPVGLLDVEFAAQECSKLLTEVKSKIECAVLCSNEPRDSCVSFYFSEARKQCRLVLYTDATINMGDARGWMKFVMKK